MATILLTWELGGGLGHLMDLRPLAQALPRRRHRVFAALRDLARADTVLGQTGIRFLQAPFRQGHRAAIDPPCTFAHILHNIGFSDYSELKLLVWAWRELFEYVQPDLIVFDYSPTALLAARGLKARKALIGTTFFSPPDVAPLPNLRTWLSVDRVRLQADEARILENMNRVITAVGQSPLTRVAQLFAEVDENFLLSFQELDCYSQWRLGAKYLGMWSADMGQPPQWPTGIGRKVFAYLKPFPALPPLLQSLSRGANPVLIYAPEIDARLRTQFPSDRVHYVDAPVEMGRAARECDVAILNGTFATTFAILLAGKPALHIPIFLEQATNARAVEQMGAGICAAPTDPSAILAGLRRLLDLDEHHRAARKFASRYSQFDPARQAKYVVDRAEQLAVHV